MRFCSDCEFLNTKDKKKDGIYMCEKCKKYMNSSTDACDKFERDLSTNNWEKNDLYMKGRKLVVEDSYANQLWFWVLIFIIILMMAITGTFNS